MLHLRGLDTVRITKVKGHADQGMVLDGRVRELDRLGNDAADEAADFLVKLSLMRVVNCLGCVGILSFLIFIGSSLPSAGLWLTVTGVMALLLILLCGLLVPSSRGVGWCMLLGIVVYCSCICYSC